MPPPSPERPGRDFGRRGEGDEANPAGALAAVETAPYDCKVGLRRLAARRQPVQAGFDEKIGRDFSRWLISAAERLYRSPIL